MRCPKCGWPNKPQERNCSKCGAVLESTDNAGNYNPESQNSPIAGTVREDMIGRQNSGWDYIDNSNDIEQQAVAKVCSKCGYPLRDGAVKCPNCNFDVSHNIACTIPENKVNPEPSKNVNIQRHPTRIVNDGGMGHFEQDNNNSTNRTRRATVNPYLQQIMQAPGFTLQPIRKIKEKQDPEPKEFEGEEVVLNRFNTDPNNETITSQKQAVISHIKGHWFIEDFSDMKTTFVQASRAMELQDGDIIVLGDRMFEFKTE